MAPPRLSGVVLSLVNGLASTGVGATLLWKQLGRDYGMNALFDLPAQSRGEKELEARPVQGAPPRTWEHRDLGVPTSERCSNIDLRAAYAQGRVSPVEVLAALRTRVEAGAFGAATHSPFVCTDWDRAQQAALASTERYRAGAPCSRLDGVPVPIKDEHEMVGLVTRAGTAYLDAVATTDSAMVAQLRGAGAVLYGKTHTTEWGMNPWGMNPHFKYPRNVYADDRGAGGSSTGSAVAVALGLASVGVGSDGGGSIRIPSAFNGIFGIKPTFGRVGRGGSLFGRGTVSHFGPLSASVADGVDLLIETANDHDPSDAATGYATDRDTVAATWLAAVGRGVSGCRIGIPRVAMAAADKPIREACFDALNALESEGAVLVDVEVPLMDQAMAVGVLSIATETMGALIDDFAANGKAMGGDLQLLMHLFQRASAKEYLLACRTRPQMRLALAQAIASVDVLAFPTTCTVAPRYPLKEMGLSVADDVANQDACRLNFLGNVTGLPAGSVPVGMHDGLPIGLQIMGDAWDEASVIAVMTHCERLGLSGLPVPEGAASLLG